jgi:hypothetical protein
MGFVGRWGVAGAALGLRTVRLTGTAVNLQFESYPHERGVILVLDFPDIMDMRGLM